MKVFILLVFQQILWNVSITEFTPYQCFSLIFSLCSIILLENIEARGNIKGKEIQLNDKDEIGSSQLQVNKQEQSANLKMFEKDTRTMTLPVNLLILDEFRAFFLYIYWQKQSPGGVLQNRFSEIFCRAHYQTFVMESFLVEFTAQKSEVFY